MPPQVEDPTTEPLRTEVPARPSASTYEMIERALTDGRSLLEALIWDLEKIVEPDYALAPANAPTVAEVGELYSFGQGIDLTTSNLRDLADRVGTCLHELDLLRLDAAVQARVTRAAPRPGREDRV
jgi:hypothetical protein